MKLTIEFKGSIYKDGKQQIFSKDIRRYIGSIVSEKYKDLFLWHEKKPSPFLYLKPYDGYFEILSYRHDLIDAFEHLISRITLNPIIKLNGIDVEVTRVMPRESSFPVIKEGIYHYRTRTPIIIGSSKTDHAIYNELKHDEEALKNYTRDLMIESVQYQIKEYFGEEFSEIENAVISFDTFKHFTTRCYHNDSFEYHPAVWCEFTSTFSLPQMIGYKFGMGHGHIVPVKEKRV